MLSFVHRYVYKWNHRKNMAHIQTGPDAIRILREIITSTGHISTDDLCTYISAMYEKTLPSEIELQRLSTLQQEYDKSGGPEEYSISTFWMCAMQSIMQHECSEKHLSIWTSLFSKWLSKYNKTIRRTQSCPALLETRAKKKRICCGECLL